MNDEQKYFKSLDKKELQSYNIAKSRLGSSFELSKSIGYIKWIQNNQKLISEQIPPKALSE